MRLLLVPTLCCAFSLPPVTAIHGQDLNNTLPTVDRSVETYTTMLRQSLAGEVFREVNAYVPKSHWIYGHVSHQVDRDSFPGVSLSIEGTPLKEAVQLMSTALNLPIAQQGKFMWIHRPLDEASLQQAREELSSAEESIRNNAFDQLVKLDHPQSIATLLNAWSTSGNASIEQHEARSAIALALGAQRSEMANRKHLIYALWGHPDPQLTRVHPLFHFHQRPLLPSSWVIVTNLAGTSGLEAAHGIIEEHPDLENDPVAITIGLALAINNQLPATHSSKLEQALTVWCLEPPIRGDRWEFGFIRTRAQHAFSLIFPDKDIPKPRQKSKKAPRRPIESFSNDELIDLIIKQNIEAKLGYQISISQGQINTAQQRLNDADPNDEKVVKELTKALKHAKAQPEQLARQLRNAIRSVEALRHFSATDRNIELAQRLLILPNEAEPQALIHQDIRKAMAEVAQDWRHPQLITLLAKTAQSDPQPIVCQAAAQSLGLQRSDEAVAALYQQLQDTGSVEQRLNALLGLTLARPNKVCDWTINQFNQSTSESEKTTILQYMGLLRQETASDFLISTATNNTVASNHRIAAAIGLRSIPSTKAQSTLKNLLLNDPNLEVRQLILQGLTPTTLTDAYNNLPLMLDIIHLEQETKLQQLILQNIQLACRLLPPGQPLRLQAGGDLITIIANKAINSNIRRFAASGIKYVDVDESLVEQLGAIVQQTKHPILKRFFNTAYKQARERISEPTESE